jgi:hypothetical protein
VHLLHVTFTIPVGRHPSRTIVDLVVVFTLQIFSRVKPLDHPSS